ncbi:MAG: peptidylprolyl isomerase [Bacteroidetes bacterium]|nr:peptidylprolyl isomerase [Bacteroidota bacterium]
MSTIKEGDTVSVHYTGTLTTGEVFDSSKNREPLTFTLGQGQLIAGFEKAVIGLSEGDSTTANIPSKEAYGEVNPEMIVDVPKNQLPTEIEAKVGMQLQLNQPNGQAIPVQITEVKEETITIDANHPLAGKDLNFDIEIVEINP